MVIKTLVKVFVSWLLLAGNLSAQPVWKNVDSIYGPLPESMHVYYTNDSIEGKPNIAFFVKAELKDLHLVFDADTAYKRGLTPSQYYSRNGNPLLVVNCTFFSSERLSLDVVIDDGKMVAFNLPSVYSVSDSLYHYVSRSALGIDRHRKADVAWVITDSLRRKAYEITNGPLVSEGSTFHPVQKRLKQEMLTENRDIKRWKAQTAVGGGPTLISDGTINITNNQERMFSGKAINDRHPRTAMGYTNDGYLIILMVEGRFPGRAEGATLGQEAEILSSLGCIEALNLDGGGSSCMLVNGKETITPSDKTGQRPVPAVFIIRQAE